MAKQFELAKLDEARNAGVLQVVDRAVAPDRKSKPKRAILVLIAFFAAGVLSLILAFGLESWRIDRVQN
jgi:uncharacterized protein involved in exopolysaccharide biosynthesis